MVFSDPSCSERVESIWGPGLGAVVVAPPAEAAQIHSWNMGLGGVTRCVPVCLMPPRPVCSAFSGTRASICAAQGPPSPHAFSCQELGPLWTPSPESLRGEALGTRALAPGHLRGSAPSMQDPGLLCLQGWGVALAPARGSVQGKPHRKRAWPNGRPSRSRPWDTIVLSHFRRRPREAGCPSGPRLLLVGAPRP